MYSDFIKKVFSPRVAQSRFRKSCALFTAVLLMLHLLSPVAVYAYEDLASDVTPEGPVEDLNVGDSVESAEVDQVSEQEDEGELTETEEGTSDLVDVEDDLDTDSDNTDDEEDENEEDVKEEEPLAIWLKNGEGLYETTGIVEANKEYVIEEFDNLKIVFTRLPEFSGKLYVKEVLVPEFVGGAEVIGRAFDITTDMAEGSFEYVLYMPKPDDRTEGERLDIKFTEDGVIYHDLQGEVIEDLYLVTPVLDHFTTFVVVMNPTPPPSSFLEMIIDNTEPQFLNPFGWMPSTASGGYYGTNYVVSDIGGIGGVEWRFEVFDSGDHGVYAWWPADPTHGDAVEYVISYQGGSSTVIANQEMNGGQWNLLGIYYFETGNIYSVRLLNNSTGPLSYVVADAVRIRSTETPSEVWVDDDWFGASSSDEVAPGVFFDYNGFDTIQEGIDAVAASGSVNVASGTFEEQLVINKDLTLSGAGITNTTILSPTVLASRFTTSGGAVSHYPIIYVTGVSSVTIEDLTIDGAGRGNGYNRFYGVAFRNGGGTVQNTSIVDIRETPFASVYPNHGVGIYAYNNDGIVRDVNILSNQINSYQKNAAAINGDSNATISGNVLVGIGTTSLVVQNGIQIYYDATASIDGNIIRDNYYTGGNTAVGILLIDIGSGLTVTNNQIFNNGAGLWNYEFGGTSPITADHNNFYNNTYNALDDHASSSWDDGSEGNSWDDYPGIDLDSDGVGDTQLPYFILNSFAVPTTTDNYPLTSNYLDTPVFTAPPDGSFGNSTTIPIIDWADVSGTFPAFEYQIQGFSDAGYTTVVLSSPWITNSDFSTGGLSDGTYYFRVRARDENGNISYWSNGSGVPYSITLDNTPPDTGDPLISPLSDSYWNIPMPVAGVTTDFFGVDFVNLYYRVSGTAGPWLLFATLDDPTDPAFYPWTYNWDPSGGTGEGTYDIRAESVDIVGNIDPSGYAYDITFDVTPPSAPSGLTLYRGHDPATWVEIGCGGYTNDTNITLIWNANPASDPIDYYWFGISGNPYYAQVFPPDTYYTIDMLSETGPYTVIAVDMAGNESSLSISCDVILDQVLPFVEITSPTTTSLVGGPVAIRGSVTDTYPDNYQLVIEDSSSNPVVDTGIIYDNTSFTDQLILSWNTTGVSDGDYTIILEAHDTAENVNQDLIVVTVDNTPPVTTISSPPSDSYWNTPIPIEGSTVDGNITQSVTLYYRAAGTTDPWSPIITLTNPASTPVFDWTYSWDPSGGPGEGVYDIRAVGEDSLGNTESGAEVYNVTYDVTAPTSTVYIAGNLEDDGLTVGTGGWHGNGWYEYYQNINLLIDTGDPSDDFIMYQVLSGDVVCPDYDDSDYVQIGHDTNVNIDVNGTDGEYTLCYYGQDNSGNREGTINSQLLRVDDTDPSFTIDNVTGNEVSGVYFNSSGTVVVTITASDNLAGYTQAQYDLYEADVDHNCTANLLGQYEDNLLPPSLLATRDLTLLGLGEGNYCLRIEVLDDAQNHSSEQIVRFTVDTTAPTSNVYITGNLEDNGLTVGTGGWHGFGWYEFYNNVNLLIDSGDPSNDFIMYQVLPGDAVCPDYDDSDYVQIGHDTNVNVDVNGTDGEYTLCYYGQDNSGNREGTINSQLLRVDDTDPIFTIDNVTGNEVGGVYYHSIGTVVVTITASDNLAGYTQAQYDLYQADVDHNCTSNLLGQYEDNLLPPSLLATRNLTLSGVSEGDYCLRIEVLDDSQNHSSEQVVRFVVDTEPPFVEITYPVEPAVLSGTVSIRGTVTDDYPDHYQLIIEDSFGNPMEDTDIIYDNISFTDQVILLDWDTTGVVDGDYTITLIAYDAADNVNQDSIVVTIDNTKPYVDPELAYQVSNEGDTISVEITGYDDVGLAQLCYQIVEIDSGVFSCEGGIGTEYVWTLDLTGLYPSLFQDGDYTFEYYLLDSSFLPNQSDADEDPSNGDQPYSAIFTVENVVPSVTLRSNQTIDEGQVASFRGEFFDPSYVEGSSSDADDAPWTVYIDYGDGSGMRELGTYSAPGTITIPDHTYLYNGVYTVRLIVTENDSPPGDGESGYDEVEVVVNDVVPSVTISASPATTVREGTSVTLLANVFGGNAPYTYRWAGACHGTASTAYVPSTAGTYICYVAVWDADGDMTQTSINIGVLEPLEEGLENSPEDEVLGAMECEQMSKVSGYVFSDEDGNSLRDDGEEGIEDILIEIYWGIESRRSVVATSRTDEDGYWEAQLCPGEYSVGINTESLTDGIELEWGNFIAITVEENTDLEDVNFPVIIHESFLLDNFSLLWCVVPLVILAILAVIIVYSNYKKGKKSEG